MIPDLAGIYVTDDHIDVVLGSDSTPGVPKLRFADLAVDISKADEDVECIPFAGKTVEAAFAEAVAFINARAPGLRSAAVGCYGPFETIDKRQRGTSGYGRLQATTHEARLLSGKSLPELLSGIGGKFKIVPITVMPDVAVAAIGELYHRGTREGQWLPGGRDKIIVFIKISIGFGGGVVRAAEPWEGRHHPEMGQLRVERWRGDAQEAAFAGTCRYHGACLEGLASVIAIEERYKPLTFAQLRDQPDHVCWEREAFYIAQACIAATSILAPDQIVLGGRVMGVPGLLDKVRMAFIELFNLREFKVYPEAAQEDYIDVDKEHRGRPGRPGARGALCVAAMEVRLETRRPVTQK